MFPPRSMLRPVLAGLLAYALLASTMSGAAVARPIDSPLPAYPRQEAPDARAGAPTSSLSGTTSKTPRQDLRSPDARDAAREQRQDLRSPDARDAANAERIARMLEPYYSSYPTPEPLTAPAPAAPADDSPWLLIGSLGAAVAFMTASGAIVLRRRRSARVAT